MSYNTTYPIVHLKGNEMSVLSVASAFYKAAQGVVERFLDSNFQVKVGSVRLQQEQEMQRKQIEYLVLHPEQMPADTIYTQEAISKARGDERLRMVEENIGRQLVCIEVRNRLRHKPDTPCVSG